MGTCDELALDVLINSFMGFSRDLAGLRRIVVGGANRDWPLPEMADDEDDEAQVRRAALMLWAVQAVALRGAGGGKGGGQVQQWGKTGCGQRGTLVWWDWTGRQAGQAAGW